MKSAVNGLPTKDDVAVCVQWPQLDNALHAKRQRSQTQDSSSEFAPSTPVQILSLPHASPEVLKTLGDLGELTEAHRRLLEELARLKVSKLKYAHLKRSPCLQNNRLILPSARLGFTRSQSMYYN